MIASLALLLLVGCKDNCTGSDYTEPNFMDFNVVPPTAESRLTTDH